MTTTAAVVPWSPAGTAAVVVDQAGAVARLPGSGTDDPYERLAVAFLLGYTPNSARAYRTDLKAWWVFCTNAGVHPFDARRHHVDAWVRTLSGATGTKAMNPASIRRRLSAVSKFYKYGIECEVLTYSPVEHVQRPKASNETSSVALTPGEITALLDRAEARSPLHLALVTLLVFNGLRIDEALGADVSDYSYQRGHRVLRITRKGGTRSSQPLAPPTVRAIDDYLAVRSDPTGPLFMNHDQTNRLPYRTAFYMVRSLAKAARIPAAGVITPHSMRHTFITEALAAGVPLQDVQDAAGHKDPHTTRRYDRSRLTHDRHPTYAFAAHLARTGRAEQTAHDDS